MTQYELMNKHLSSAAWCAIKGMRYPALKMLCTGVLSVSTGVENVQIVLIPTAISLAVASSMLIEIYSSDSFSSILSL